MLSFVYLSICLPLALAAPQRLWPRDTNSSGDAASIDLSPWKLQLPVGKPGHPTTISGSELAAGYSDKDHFFTDGDLLVMKVPGSPSSTGCVTTPNSKHCRTELRETEPDKWDPTDFTNVLRATLTVVEPDNSKFGTVVGQIHIDDDVSTKPVCELFYNQNGTIKMGVERTRNGGNLQYRDVGNVPVGQEWEYEIRYENGELSVAINGAKTVLDTFELDNLASYFKAGNYNQGDSKSEVRFREITVEH